MPENESSVSIWTGGTRDANHFRVRYNGTVGADGRIHAAGYDTDSSREIKHDIRKLEYDSDVIDQLQPVSFVYNRDESERPRYGLLYEDTLGLMPGICNEDDEGKSISYVELVPVLLNEVQKLRARVKALEAA